LDAKIDDCAFENKIPLPNGVNPHRILLEVLVSYASVCMEQTIHGLTFI